MDGAVETVAGTASDVGLDHVRQEEVAGKMAKSFTQRVYETAKKIPVGRVVTYQDLARMAGSPRAARAVGLAMKNNPDLKTIPCHRVVGADGRMHGYSAAGGIANKTRILKREGVVFIGGKVDLGRCRWAGGKRLGIIR